MRRRRSLFCPTDVSESCDAAIASEVHFCQAGRQGFDLIFKENVNYGFRRNLWGMKPVEIVVAIVSVVAAMVPAVMSVGGELPIVAVR